uniref:Reverse transcriptase zinc-binding domain-containing protein n=1 Tax=Hordeum vulgare subsp. vulgare TaxID=112509 RepID=A0A8I6YHA6_HORVV
MARLEQLIEHIKCFPLSKSQDLPVWLLEPNGKYSVKSFYNCINFGGVVSPFGDTLWKTLCPQNIHVFLWLCLYNKILIRDNVAKRKIVDDLSCLFCNEVESIQHLFFDCINASSIWSLISEFFHHQRIKCFDDISSLWKFIKKRPMLHLVTVASLWSIWRLRNEFCLQGHTWKGLGFGLAKLKAILQQWVVLCEAAQADTLRRFVLLLDKHRGELMRIAWIWTFSYLPSWCNNIRLCSGVSPGSLCLFITAGLAVVLVSPPHIT